MPAQPRLVEIRGLNALRQRLQPGQFFKPVRKHLIEAASKAAHLTARRAAKGKAGKGNLGRAIVVEFANKGMTATVKPTSRVYGISTVIEYGRTHGRRPPYKRLRLWAERAGVSMPVRELQEEIKLRGTEGVGFMEAAEGVANKVIATGIRETEAEIKALWERPRL